MIEQVYDELAFPTAKQLHAALLSRGEKVSLKEVREFINKQPEQQTYNTVVSKGKEATRSDESTMQADIIDMYAYRSSGFRAILFTIDPWNRKIHMEALEDKKPSTVLEAFKKAIRALGKKETVDTDQGGEFSGPFEKFLKQEGIVHRYKDKRMQNTLSIMDRAIQTVKVKLFKMMEKRNTKKWQPFLKQVQDGYNNTIHGSIGTTPNKFDKDEELQFERMKQAANNLEHNSELLASKAQKVQEAGVYREQLPRKDFTRAWKPKFGAIQDVGEVSKGQVISTTGKTAPLQAVKEVPVDTVRTEPMQFSGRDLRDEALKQKLRKFANDLYDAMGDKEIALTSAARLLSGSSFGSVKPSKFSFLSFLQLFPNIFKVSGEGPSKKVKAIRRRVRGKQ
jgi:hypothetical protein